MAQPTAPPIPTPPEPQGRAGYMPLYLQVKQQLIAKMIAGDWPPGALLPSEQQLGLQMGVSQGTVRKALDALAAEHLVVRQQGRGTFVAEHDQQRTLFQFFKIVDETGERRFPEATLSRIGSAAASASDRASFGLEPGTRVWTIYRERALKGRVALTERLRLPVASFPGLDAHKPLPNNLYQFYEQAFGVTIVRAIEHLRAVRAGAQDAQVLGCAADDPVLEILRTAYALNGRAVETRRTVCLTDSFHYLSDLQ